MTQQYMKCYSKLPAYIILSLFGLFFVFFFCDNYLLFRVTCFGSTKICRFLSFVASFVVLYSLFNIQFELKSKTNFRI